MRVLFAIIHTLTGAVTFSGGQRGVWKIVQKGSGSNDYVLVPKSGVPSPDGVAASAATDFFRLRAWKEQPTVRFLALGEQLRLWSREVVR